jgi:protein-disulfide isomerase
MHSKGTRLTGLWYVPLLLAGVVFVGSAAVAAPPGTTESGTMNVGSKRIEPAPRAKVLIVAETYQGIPVGFTTDGHPFRGNADAAVTLVEYTDYVCPFCARYFQQTLPVLLDKYGRSGQVKFVVDDFPLDSLHPTAPQGAAAAACVAEQGAARFWQMHDALFKDQQEWGRLPDPASFLADAAKKTGVNMNTYKQCMTSGRVKAQVEQRVAASKALGFTGTPSFQFVQQKTGKTYTLVGAQPVDVFATWLDALLAGKEPPQTQKPARPELPEWAKAEGLAPDPKRPGFTVAGDPYKGNPSAKLVLVEFGDFQCASCQRHVLATQPELDKRFVESGDVLWVVKHFPLRIHSHAPVAAAAAECAGDQGKFWAMHHLLFERMEQWSTGDDADAALARLASELKLDGVGFSACLKGRTALERVLRDLYDGQAIGIRSIPAFILLHGGTSYVLTGARSTEQFAATLEQQLEAAKSQAKGADTLANR